MPEMPRPVWRLAVIGRLLLLPLLPAAQCLTSLALFASDHQALFSGAPATTEEALCAGLDTAGLVADCAGGLPKGGGGDGPEKPRDGNEDGGGGRPGCNSFRAGTGVLLADGTRAPIEEVEAGERVWAADPVTGEAGGRAVTDAWRRPDGPLVTLYTLGAAGRVGQLTATADHPVWEVTDRAWEPAGGLGRGDALLGADGLVVTVVDAESAERETVVFDLTVADLHTFFVRSGDHEILVHNAGCSRRLGSAMAGSGRPRPGEGWEAHHIVAGGDTRADPAREVLERYGIDDPDNGVWLPGPTAGGGTDAASHRPVHTNAYYDDVNDALSGASSEEDARSRLRALEWLLDKDR